MVMRQAPLALLGALALLLAACGGDDSSSGATSAAKQALTHQALVSQGNQVCIDTDRAVAKLGHPTRTPPYWNKLIPLSEEAYAKMAALEPGANDRARFEHMLDLARREIDALRQIRDSIRKADYTSAQKHLRAATNLDTKVKFAAKDVGFDFCSQLLSNWPA